MIDLNTKSTTVRFDKPTLSPVLVGRAGEIQTLERLVDSVKDGSGRCAVLAGEAGVGKSRLLAEIRSRVADAGFLTLQGHCFEQDSSLPYAPLIDALRRATPDALQLPGDLAPEFIELVPVLAEPAPGLQPAVEKRRPSDVLAQFVVRLCAVQPLLFSVEDLQWSDKTSLDFLLSFARRLESFPILLILTYSPEEVSPQLMHFLAQFDRARLAYEIALRPLERAEVETMVRAIFDVQQPIKAEFVDLILSRTEGNPFFIEEVLKALVEAGDIFYTGEMWDRRPVRELRVPRSVQHSVYQRLEQLSPGARELLTRAAVAGRRFDFSLLQELTGRAEHELVKLIKELIAAQLVVEESADQFAFRHALTREAVYATLLARERRALHRSIAEAIERLHADYVEGHLADLAYHFYEAGVWAKALEYSQRAGEKAQTLHAPRAAVQQFTRALEAARHLSLPPPLALYRARAQAYETLGESEHAQANK